ncbi:MAG: type 1 glutamine amidotransferase [Candidatus Micrarchaeota archaeon]
MDGNRTRIRIAVIGTENANTPLKAQDGMSSLTAETAKRFDELGAETITYKPAEDGKDLPGLGACDAIVIGGSKLNIRDEDLHENPWMHTLLDFIGECHGEVPMLGICFGHQAIARRFGVKVQSFGPDIVYGGGFSQVSLTEDGKKDALFAGMPDEFAALFSHFYYVPQPPESGTALLCGINPGVHAFRVGERTWGVQYHPELTVSSARWLLSQKREALEAKGVDVNAMIESLSSGPRIDNLVLNNFAEIVKKG